MKIKQIICLHHRGITEKKPEGNAHWTMVYARREIDWNFPLALTKGVSIDNRLVDSVSCCTKTGEVTVTMHGTYNTYNNLDDLKADYPGWQVDG